MSQTAITYAFEQWKAQQAAEGVDVVLDEFVFANVPGLDPLSPIDRTEEVPVEHIVYRQAVTQTGRVNENAVVYSIVLDAYTGDFSFNWIGLVNSGSGTLAMVIHAPEQQKMATKEGQQGNTLTRSFLMEYNGAANETAINTPAETWQIDFTARLSGMDERQRLENIDIYGEAAFFDDGWLITKSDAGYVSSQGAGYVKGLRAQLDTALSVTVGALPSMVWIDVCWTGALTSVWQTESKLTAAESLSDYELNGIQHFVFALASIDVSGNITDLRPKGNLSDQQASNDFLRKAANLSDLADPAESRKSLGLGSAALVDVVDSATDATAGRLPNVGWMGIGGNNVGMTNTDILSAAPVGSRLFTQGNGNNSDHFGGYGVGIHMLYGVSGDGTQCLTGNLFIDSNGELSVEWLAINIANGSLAYQALKTWISTSGGTITADSSPLVLKNKTQDNALYILAKNADNTNRWFIGNGSNGSKDASFINSAGGNGITFSADGTISMNGKTRVTTPLEYASSSTNSYRIAYGDYGIFWRNDGMHLYLMVTNKGDPYGNFNEFRPFRLELVSGNPQMGKLSLTDYANFDARYYTQTTANEKFITGVRMGASSLYQERGNNERMTGGVMTSWADVGSSNYWMRLRPLQYLLNGSWVTAAYA